MFMVKAPEIDNSEDGLMLKVDPKDVDALFTALREQTISSKISNAGLQEAASFFGDHQFSKHSFQRRS
jgi:hypothetical protein